MVPTEPWNRAGVHHFSASRPYSHPAAGSRFHIAGSPPSCERKKTVVQSLIADIDTAAITLKEHAMESRSDQHTDAVFARHYHALAGPLTGFIQRLVYRRDIAEELVQDVFLRIFERGIDIGDKPGEAAALVYTMGRNITIDYLRRLRNERHKYRLLRADGTAPDQGCDRSVEEAWVDGQVISTLHDTIDALPDDDRRLFLERNFDNVSGAALARDRGVSTYRIRRIEQGVRTRIRERLKGFYPDAT